VTLSVAELAKSVELTEEEISEYYQQNPLAYTRPEQAKVSYIELSAEALKGQIQVSDEQAEQYYQEHLDKYSTEEQRKVSHILVQGDDEAKAQAILDELNAGADFAALAEEKSDDFGSADVGGDLGWIERDVMDPAFEDAAFALENVGDTTGLVKSEFGYHIIKLDELQASKAQPFSEVAAEIKQELLDQEAVDQFYELQTELEKVAFEYPDSLDDSAEAINAKIQTTDFVSQIDAPELLKTPAVMQAILSPEVKEDGLNSEVIEVAPEHVIVVRVEETRDETVLPLEEVQDQVVAALSAVKAEQQAIELGVSLVNELKAGNEAVLAENNLTFSELETIDRSSPLASSVFAFAKPEADQPVFGQAKDQNGNIVVVELSKVTADINPAYSTQIGAQLERVGNQQDLTNVLNVLRKNADVEYYIVGQGQ
jgi:peptidyl-prolyl cis-trans isomerase D